MIYIFLFYVIFLIAFFLYSLAGLYHLRRFGYVGDLTRPVIIIYTVLSLGVIGVTFGLITWYAGAGITP